MKRTSTLFFFFNDTATTEIYTLSLHDALPISQQPLAAFVLLADNHRTARKVVENLPELQLEEAALLLHHQDRLQTFGEFGGDRKSTRLNSSHLVISYAVFCLKKKKQPRP